MALWHASAAVSHVESDGAEGTQPVGLLYFTRNLPLTFWLHAGWTAAVPLVASLREQPRRPDSFLPIALTLAPLHLSAPAGPAPTARRKITPTAAIIFFMSPLSSCAIAEGAGRHR
jgi:hypothetical protein